MSVKNPSKSVTTALLEGCACIVAPGRGNPLVSRTRPFKLEVCENDKVRNSEKINVR